MALRPEWHLQIACAKLASRIILPGWFWTARDLATKSAIEGQQKKAMGCKPGLSDMEFWLPRDDPRRRLHAEAKDAKSREQAIKKLEDTQRAMIPIIEAHGEAFDVFWSAVSFVEMLTRHGIPWRQNPLDLTPEQIDIMLAQKAEVRKTRKPGPARKARPSQSSLKRVAALRAKGIFQ